MRNESKAALEAITIAQAVIAREGNGQITSKGGRDLVTAADVAAEDAIRREVLQRYPSYPVVGEERGGEAARAGRPYWLVDPICGTRAFASGIPLYAINITLVEDGEAVLAAIGDGSNGAIYLAERGVGAWMCADGGLAPLRTSDASSILWVAPGGSRATDQTAQAAGFIRAAMLADRWFVWMLGTSLALAYLASGRIAAYVSFVPVPPLHNAPGCLLASEAGATVTDFKGESLALAAGSFVAAATPELHSDLLGLVATAVEAELA